MSSQDRQLEQWLRQQLFRQRDQPLEKFSLRSAAQGSRGQEVEAFDISGNITGDQVPSVRDEILARAQSDADGLGTKLQRYILLALEVGAKTGPRFAFRVKGEGDDDDEDGEEKPNEKGLVSQLMRHNEAMMRAMTMGTNATIGHLSRQVTELSQVNQMLVTRQAEGFAALESAKSQQHDREVELLLVAGQEERKNTATQKVVSKIELLFPIIFNKLAGKAVLSAEEHGVLGEFVESLSNEQLQRIAQQLSPEQQMALFSMYKEIKAKNSKTPSGNEVS